MQPFGYRGRRIRWDIEQLGDNDVQAPEEPSQGTLPLTPLLISLLKPPQVERSEVGEPSADGGTQE
ncbi:MAG: hypothetical protein ABSB96_05065 [Gaiellaceae bacterium]